MVDEPVPEATRLAGVEVTQILVATDTLAILVQLSSGPRFLVLRSTETTNRALCSVSVDRGFCSLPGGSRHPTSQWSSSPLRPNQTKEPRHTLRVDDCNAADEALKERVRSNFELRPMTGEERSGAFFETPTGTHPAKPGEIEDAADSGVGDQPKHESKICQ